MPVLNVEKLIENRVEALRFMHENTGIQRAELDVSGGIDSAVMLGLLCKALGPENVTAVYQGIKSSQVSLERARLVAETFGVRLIEAELSKGVQALVEEAMRALQAAGYDMDEIIERKKNDPLVEGSFRSCSRAPFGRFMNRLTGGGIRHGTGNEDEDRWLRFYQKGGDGEVDTNPLAFLSKGEVYQLAVGLGVPEEIVTCMPTPDLWGTGDQHSDEAELTEKSGVDWSYSRVDPKTGEYVKVGTIERMSRFLDEYPRYFQKEFFAVYGFDGNLDRLTSIEEQRATTMGLTKAHLASALEWELSSRHKENPNCPSLGKRHYLVEEGILTDELPQV